MKQWSTLNPIEDDAIRGGPAIRLVTEINDAIGRLAAERAAFDRTAAELAALDGSTFKAGHVDVAKAQDVRRIELLRAESALRRRIDVEFAPLRDRCRRAARVEADAAAAAAEKDLTEKLVAIGYVVTDNHQELGRIIPDFYHRHPEVRRLRGEVETRGAAVQDCVPVARENLAALAAVDVELTEWVRRVIR